MLTAVPALDQPDDLERRERVARRLDRKTKPVGALGRLESLAVQAAVVLGTDTPRLRHPQLVVFAGDHGLAAHGVSAYPQDVTAQMVSNMLDGGAAVSVLARRLGLALTVVDCGVRADFQPRAGLVRAKVAPGTADASTGPAMTPGQGRQALQAGAAIARDLRGDVLLLGEMGIGNTSAASLLMARLTGRPLADCIGRGTGLDDTGLQHKAAVLTRALSANPPTPDPLDTLCAFGGFEIAAMCGAVLQAAADRRLVVVDGFITTAAVAVAAALAPAVLQRCVFAHASAESGHARWLADLGVQPLLDLGLRLGEGSGAALAWPLLDAACALLDEMASFESAGISDRAGAATR